MAIRSGTAAAAVALSLLFASGALAQQSGEGEEAASGGGQMMSDQSGQGMSAAAGSGMMPGMMHRGRGRHGGGMGPGGMLMMFVLMDTDGNEALSLDEVLSAHERMFNYVDADDDGSVTMDEMQAFMQRMHGGMR